MNTETARKTRQVQYGLIAKIVRDIQYHELKKIDFRGKTVLEIGPGAHMDHYRFWNARPELYTVVDVDCDYLKSIRDGCTKLGFNPRMVHTINVDENWTELNWIKQYDIVIAFNILEHLSNLDYKIYVLKNLTKETFIGSIPAEGGMMWGLGRRLFAIPKYKKMGIDTKTEVSRQHVNCSRCVESAFIRNWDVEFKYWPFPFSRNLSIIARIKHELD